MFGWCCGCCGGADTDFIGDMYSPLLDDSKPPKNRPTSKSPTTKKVPRWSAFDDANRQADKEEDANIFAAMRPKRLAFAKVNRTPNTRKLINGLNNILVNTLPELERLFPCDTEEQLEDTLFDFISVMLEVVSGQDTTMTFPYRMECLRQATPREHQLIDYAEGNAASPTSMRR